MIYNFPSRLETSKNFYIIMSCKDKLSAAIKCNAKYRCKLNFHKFWPIR